jgi:hypothetical protein
MISRYLPLTLIAALIVPAPLAHAGQRTSALPPPGIRSDPAWLTLTTGPTTESQHLPPQLFAIAARPSPGALTPFDLASGLENLSATAALLWATTAGKGKPTQVFRAAAWPPRLRDFRLDRFWEGQPLRRVQQRLLWVAAEGWQIDVRVYFGTQHPSKPLLAAVQAELNRLMLPAS